MAGLSNPSESDASSGAGGPLPAIDMDTLGQLRQLDPTGTSNIIQRVLETYHRSLVKLASDFAAAREAGDLPVLMRIAHTLRSSSASVGALVLSGCCKEVEIRIRDGRLEGLEPLLQELQNESERVQETVAAMLSVRGPSL